MTTTTIADKLSITVNRNDVIEAYQEEAIKPNIEYELRIHPDGSTEIKRDHSPRRKSWMAIPLSLLIRRDNTSVRALINEHDGDGVPDEAREPWASATELRSVLPPEMAHCRKVEIKYTDE